MLAGDVVILITTTTVVYRGLCLFVEICVLGARHTVDAQKILVE